LPDLGRGISTAILRLLEKAPIGERLPSTSVWQYGQGSSAKGSKRAGGSICSIAVREDRVKKSTGKKAI